MSEKQTQHSPEWHALRARVEANPELLKQYTPRLNRFVKQEPHAKQLAGLLFMGMESFWGGAGGPGKTSWLLMKATQFVDCKNYKAIILRRKWGDFEQPDGIIPRSKDWWDGAGPIWNEGKKRWTFPSGATLSLMHMEHEDDMYNIKGSQAHFIGIDEGSEFTGEMILYCFRSLRKAVDDPIPLRLAISSNPGGPGHAFLKKRYIARLGKGQECATFKIVNPYDKKKSHDCMVLLATAKDNPYLDQGYLDNLDNLSPLERRRQKFGDWDALAGGRFFDRDNFQIIDRIPCEIVASGRAWDRAGSVDESADYTCGAGGGLGVDGNLYVTDMIRDRWMSGGVDQAQVATAEADGIDTTIFIQQDPAAAGKSEAERLVNDVLARFNVIVETVATNVKGAKALRARPLAAASERKQVYFLRAPWNEPALDELEQFTEDGTHDKDDQVDVLALLYRKLVNPNQEIVETVLVGPDHNETDIESLLDEWR